MTDAELEDLLADLESDRTERKESLADARKIREAICAFANDMPDHQAPGVLFIGARDDGSCAGLKVSDEILRTLADMRSDGNIVPFPSMTVQKRVLRGCEMAVAVVQPADAPPVRYQGRIWIRVGPRRAVATRQEESRLAEKRRAGDLPFDIHPVRGASLEDLDRDLFRNTYLPASVAPEVIEENRRGIEEQMLSLRLVAREPRGYVPTVLGLLVAGKDPRAFLPGAWVQFLRLDGESLSDPIRDATDISGPLPDLLRQLESKFQAHLQVARDFTSGPIEKAQPDFPIVALQQIARNAILHRVYEGTNAPVRLSWFSGRIEIHSPGGPYGQVTRANFGSAGITDYRNPNLAGAMRNLGYVQRFGVGIATAQRAMEENGNPLIEFRVEDSHVLAILRRRP